MKKFFSTIIVMTGVFVFTAFADDTPPPVITCADGHMHLPGYTCTPPDGDDNRRVPDDSTLTYIKTLIDEFNPFFYFLK